MILKYRCQKMKTYFFMVENFSVASPDKKSANRGELGERGEGGQQGTGAAWDLVGLK